MAENIQMKLPYVLRKNTSSNPRMSGKYYGRYGKRTCWTPAVWPTTW